MIILMFSGDDFSQGGPPLQEVKANIGSNASLRCEATIKFADCKFRAPSGEVRTIPTDCGRREREEKIDSLCTVKEYPEEKKGKVCGIIVRDLEEGYAGEWR